MRYVRLARGVSVSALCLGTRDFGSRLDAGQSCELLDAAVAAGISFLDVADVYPVPLRHETFGVSESIIGSWLRSRRANVTVGTKFRLGFESRPSSDAVIRAGISACDASLRRLGRESIEFFFLHHPDPVVRAEDLLEIFQRLIQAGKIHCGGVSNYGVTDLESIMALSGHPPGSQLGAVQLRYGLLHRAPELAEIALCQQRGLSCFAYNVLASGLLSSQYLNKQVPPPRSRFASEEAGDRYRQYYWNQPSLDRLHALAAIAAEFGLSVSELAIAWAGSRPGITSLVIGATTSGQLDEAAEAIDKTLPQEAQRLIEDCTAPPGAGPIKQESGKEEK